MHGTLDVLHARDLGLNAFVLEPAALAARVIVGSAVVHPVECEARIVADHRPERRQAAPEHALTRRLAYELVDRLRCAWGVPAVGKSAELVVLEIRRERIRTREQITNRVAQQRVITADRESGRRIGPCNGEAWRPGVTKLANEQILIALVEIDALEVS